MVLLLEVRRLPCCAPLALCARLLMCFGVRVRVLASQTSVDLLVRLKGDLQPVLTRRQQRGFAFPAGYLSQRLCHVSHVVTR